MNLEVLYSSLQQPISDKGTTHSYLPIYQKEFEEFQDSQVSILEIGVWQGASLHLWDKYFVNARVIAGLDIDLNNIHKPFLTEKIKLFQGNATNFRDIDAMMDKLGDIQFDFIIDDGSHVLGDQLVTMKYLWPYLRSGGSYFIEDIQNPANDIPIFQQSDCIIHDVRPAKGRYDDIIIQFNKKQ